MTEEPSTFALPDPPPPSHLRGRFAALGQATAFAVLTVVLWILTTWLLFGQSWIEHSLVLSVLSLVPAVCASNALFVLLNPDGSWDALGLPCSTRGFADLAGGTLGGAAIALSVVSVLWLLGWIVAAEPNSIAANGGEEVVWSPGWAYATMILFVGATSEELLFRGFGLQQLIRASNAWIAIVGTSVVFGLLHAGNPGASTVGLVNTALFGCLFGFLLVRRRSLMIPVGVHFGWNVTLVAIGASLSGLRIRVVDVMLTSSGPVLWSGGPYGPEASLITSLVVALVIAIVLYLPSKLETGPRLWD